jgi:quinol monooxygenase YgiN
MEELMYGTVAKLKVKAGAVDEFKSQIDERQPKGFMGTYVFQSDEDPQEVWLIALFEDKKTYFDNAESPEQDEEFQELHKYMTAEPEWHDGKVVFHYQKNEK